MVLLTATLSFPLGSTAPLTLTHVMLGDGYPSASHTRLTFSPSFRDTVCEVLACMIDGGTGKKMNDLLIYLLQCSYKKQGDISFCCRHLGFASWHIGLILASL